MIARWLKLPQRENHENRYHELLEIGHIDPDSAPHAGILAKKRATHLQNEREEQFSQPHHFNSTEKHNQGVTPLDFRARVVSASNLGGGETDLAFLHQPSLASGPESVQIIQEDITPLPIQKNRASARDTLHESELLDHHDGLDEKEAFFAPCLGTDAQDVFVFSEAQVLATTPRTAREAVSSPAAALWLVAMNREKDCHRKNRTFGEVCPALSSVKPTR